MIRGIKIIGSLIVLSLFIPLFTNHSYAKTVISAPFLKQLPELPRGCEVTSLAMLLQHAGVKAGKLELANEVKKVPFTKNGLQGNPYDGFVGNMYTFSEPGLGVYNRPIANLAEKYLPNRVINLTGSNFSNIYKFLDHGVPVWVITNSQYRNLPDSEFMTWQTKKGPIHITYREHSVLITGYDSNYFYINDPLYDKPNRAVPKKRFIDAWNQMGKQAISYYPKNANWFIDTMDHWAEEDIAYLKKKRLINGISTQKFGPNEPITREQAAVIIDRALKIQVYPFKRLSFTDLNPNAPSYISVAKVVQKGFISSIPTKTRIPSFEPKKPLKRGEMARLFAGSFGLSASNGASLFTDVSTSSKYYTSIQALGATRIISTGGKFHPNDDLTRAQFASILAKLLKTH